MRCLARNLGAVVNRWMRDLVWNTTPQEAAICAEVMMFTVAAEIAQWPDDWKHKHYFGPPVGFVCNCGTCIHGFANPHDHWGVWNGYSKNRDHGEHHCLDCCRVCEKIRRESIERAQARGARIHIRLPNGRSCEIGDWVQAGPDGTVVPVGSVAHGGDVQYGPVIGRVTSVSGGGTIVDVDLSEPQTIPLTLEMGPPQD